MSFVAKGFNGFGLGPVPRENDEPNLLWLGIEEPNIPAGEIEAPLLVEARGRMGRPSISGAMSASDIVASFKEMKHD